MISLRNLTLSRAATILLDGADALIQRGEKVGLIGANGSGKSSLLALLRGELHEDAGDVSLPPGITIAHVAQETPALPVPAIEHVLDGDAELRAVEAELAAAEAGHDGHRIAEAHARYAAIDGYAARARAGRILAGLGFAQQDLARHVAEFSGGWRVRLNLARALVARADLLLLDEPTNHLDLDAIVWLEQWLAAYEGTLIVISHDREFLDGTVNRICQLEARRLAFYAGDYSAFETQRAARLAVQQAAHAKQQREIAHMRAFVERFRYKATKARQAQSRLKALARMELIAQAHVDSPFEFSFREPQASPERLLSIEEASVGYGGKAVLAGVDVAIEAGARIGLLGRNGAGKSTLVKLLAGELAPLAGRRQEGKGLAVGYFAQHQVDTLDGSLSVIAHLQRLAPEGREAELRTFLGGFDFRGERVFEPVGPFSGGEKSRLALALVIWQRPNLLLLDEPTNHLDLDMREALTIALQDYQGAIVLVSHDRHLLATTTDRLYLVAGGRATGFDGDLEDYRAWLTRGAAQQAEAGPAGASRAAERREEKREAAEARNRLSARRRPLEQRIAALEQEIAALEGELASIETRLAAPEAYRDDAREQLKATLQRRGLLAAELDRAETGWLEAHQQLQSLQVEAGAAT